MSTTDVFTVLPPVDKSGPYMKPPAPNPGTMPIPQKPPHRPKALQTSPLQPETSRLPSPNFRPVYGMPPVAPRNHLAPAAYIG